MIKVSREVKTHNETNKNENITNQNLWCTVKTVLKGKYIVLNTHI